VPYKRRGTKARDGQITDAAVELYRRGLKSMRRDDEDVLADFSGRLARELGLRPWCTCPLDTIGYSEPPEWEREGLAAEDWYRSAAIRDQLEAALRDKRRAAQRKAPAEPV